MTKTFKLFKDIFSIYKQSKLLFVELFLLFFMIASLPSIEAPKNIFLVLFVMVAFIRQVKTNLFKAWDSWDWIFSIIILSAFLSTIFAGISPGDEWDGFRVLLTFISVGWLVSRSNYSIRQLSWIFYLIIFSTLPPLVFAYWEVLISHTRTALELHSVGHVNHSAIYLTIIFGASFGLFLASCNALSFTRKVSLTLFFLAILFYSSIIFGQSRAALGISFLIAILLVKFSLNSKKIKLISLCSILLITASIVLFNAPVIHKNSVDIKNNDVLAGRSKIWNTTVESARLSPYLGIGIDNRAFVSISDIKKSIEARNEYFDESLYDFHNKHSHSFYLTNIAERGILGSLVTIQFILMWIIFLKKTFQLSSSTTEGSFFWSGSFSSFLATFGIGFVNTTFHHEHGILACLFLGLHIAFVNTHRSKFKKLPAPQ